MMPLFLPLKGYFGHSLCYTVVIGNFPVPKKLAAFNREFGAVCVQVMAGIFSDDLTARKTAERSATSSLAFNAVAVKREIKTASFFMDLRRAGMRK